MRLTNTEAKILRALANRGWLVGLEILRVDPEISRASLYPNLVALRAAELVDRRTDSDDEFVRFQFRITARGLGALIDHKPKREGFIRRTLRRVARLPGYYLDEWRFDWFSMALSHALLALTFTLGFLSAWGFIP